MDISYRIDDNYEMASFQQNQMLEPSASFQDL